MITIQNVQKAMIRKGYRIFEDDSKNYNLNLVGIRSSDTTPNVFNDWFCVFWKFKGVWSFHVYECTTDPGLYWLQNPMNVNGTAILKEGQYSGMWALGLHQGKYKALKQVRDCIVIRDFDRDSEHDYNSGKEEKGLFGINGHRANSRYESKQVDKWSAGCQVLCNPVEFDNLINLCELGKDNWGDSFTYTLLHETDLEN